ncbi:outer membrane beta-barrel protein [Ahrensia marina]|uniref:Outer membrane beta-barrel protein n=1 Tax=Ahrensia marina TaxID=1514904 RepID=A0A0N0E6R1_9HYPH|nr:outer membrane beta-barrel protein [Ahrensia marina]KPB00315.1 hypothetical protein SU32_14450 [Ahrensia marina]
MCEKYSQIADYGMRRPYALRVLLACMLCSTVILPASAQEADDDILIIENQDEIEAIIDENADADDLLAEPVDTTQRIGPVGGVDQGTVIDEGDPYAAQGIRLGNFTFRPSVEIGYSATRTTTKFNSGSGIGESTSDQSALQSSLRLLVNSDWSRHALQLDLGGSIPTQLTGEEDDPVYDADASLRLDITNSTTLTLGGRLNVSSDDPQSADYFDAIDPVLFPGVRGVNDPTTRSYGGSAALAHDFGGVTAALTAAIQRLEYSAARLSDGRTISQSDLNSTNYDITLRGGYALSGVLSPFVEFNYGQRVMDEAVDSAGVDRNATRYGLRLGTEIDMGEKLSGEIAVGYGWQDLADARFDDVHGATIDAEFTWSPLRGTDVTWATSTSFQNSGNENVAGSILYATELGLQHRILSNLTATATLGAEYEAFTGAELDEKTLSGELGLVYNLNRFVALTGRVRHEKTFTSDAASHENTTSGFVGLRLQR